MRRKLKHYLSLFAVLAVVLSGLLVTAVAVAPLDGIEVTASKTSVSWGSGGTCALDNGEVTITAQGYYSAVLNEVTIKNTSTTSKARITFDYTAGGDLESISGTDVTGNTGSFDETLDPEGTRTITITCTKGSGLSGSKTATLVLSNFTYKEIGADVTATMSYDSTLGSVTAGTGGAVVSNGGSVTLTSEGIAMTATPSGNAQFVAWINADTDELISTSASFSLQPITGLTKIKALFEGGTTAWYLAGGTKVYSNFADACTFASTADVKQVVALNSGTMSSGEHTVPSVVTFLIPYSNSNFTVAETTATDASGLLKSTWANANIAFTADYNDNSGTQDTSVTGVMDPGDPYRTLTVASGSTLNVAGRLVIGGTIVGGTNNTRGVCGGTAEAHANLQLNGTLNITGTLSCCGYILGNGTLNIANGGNVYQPFTLMDHRDGHYAANSSGDNTFPFNRYTMNNIQCPINMVYGARMYGYIDVFTQPNSTAGTEAQHNVACQLIIGTSNDTQCLIKLISGASVALTYDANTYVECASENERGYYKQVGRTTMTITGGATFGYMEITVYVPILGNQTSNSSNCTFAIPYNYNIALKTGEYSIDNSLMLLPGAEMTVASDATLTATKGAFVVFDGFRDYAYWTTPVEEGKWYTYHYPSTSDLQSNGTLTSNGTANFIVDGTLTVNSGASFGGYIQTMGASGKVVMSGTANATVGIGHIGDLGGLYGYAVNDQAGRTERTLAAQLYKGDGSVLTMTSGTTYYANSNDTNEIKDYSYNLYTDASSKSSYVGKTESLNASISGTWCTIDDHTSSSCDICGFQPVSTWFVDNDTTYYYGTLAKPIIKYTGNGYIQIVENANGLNETVSMTADKTIPLNVNGNAITLNQAADSSGKITICGLDSSGDGFGNPNGSIVGNVTIAPVASHQLGGTTEKHYVPIQTTDDGVTTTQFHRVAASITAVQFYLANSEAYLTAEAVFRGTVKSLDALTDLGFIVDGANNMFVGTHTVESETGLTTVDYEISSIKNSQTGYTNPIHYTFKTGSVTDLQARMYFGSTEENAVIDETLAACSSIDAFDLVQFLTANKSNYTTDRELSVIDNFIKEAKDNGYVEDEG